ncbi:MAG: hypothetical protein KDE28_05895, partial [Anaerolineales bacterium]|nr:hypothetical protein [Anaerolineales bacterium]
MKHRKFGFYTLLVLSWLFLACGAPAALPTATSAAPASTLAVPTTEPINNPAAPAPPIIVGVEYILLDQAPRVARQAAALAPIGFGGAKHYAEHVEWGVMQPAPDAAINFSRLDNFVSTFQAHGFTELVITLKSHSSWASVDARPLLGKNASPKAEYRAAYASWISQVVERYDGDGHDDMAGLQFPVRYYEIGSEFSSYEPEPVADYLTML